MAGPILLSRIAAALVRGYMGRHRWRAGTGFGTNPHIYNGRAGILDIDIMQHMNNASYLTHAELARWELFAQSGLIHWSKSRKAMFILTAASIRYRREIKAFQSFEIHTSIIGADNKSVFISQDFHSTDDNQLLAQYICRSILRNTKNIPPSEFITAIGANDKLIHDISSPNTLVSDMQALELTMRKTADNPTNSSQ
jgi:YbgC/YbaW family acyl-CoA thioester hydrolase